MTGIDRRTVIGWGAAVALAVGWRWGPAFAAAPDAAAPHGYGIDPPLVAPQRQVWPRVLGDARRRDLDALIDVVVPGIDGSPPGSQLGLFDFFDEWLGAPYPDMLADRAVLMPLIERAAGLGAIAAAGQAARVEALANGPDRVAFARFCTLAAAAYHTTPAGMAALGYIGNEPRDRFEGPPREVLAHFDAELARLQLKR